VYGWNSRQLLDVAQLSSHAGDSQVGLLCDVCWWCRRLHGYTSEELSQQIVAGKLSIQIGKTFKLDEIMEAHKCMEKNEAGGKIVVLVE
jgi:hypothetical protein